MKQYSAPPAMVIDPKKHYTATVKTEKGDFVIELFADKAPNTVNNFVFLSREGFYNGVTFHRVIKGFMVQGGGMEPGLKQKATRAAIQNEANNGLKNDKYTIAMARTNAPHSATAQFFINVASNDFLNFRAENAQGWGYAVFGRVVDGTAVVDQIEKVRTGSRGFHDDVPVDDVVITRAVIVE